MIQHMVVLDGRWNQRKRIAEGIPELKQLTYLREGLAQLLLMKIG